MRSSVLGVAERILRSAAFLLAAVYLITGVAYLWLDYWPNTEADFWQIYDLCFHFPWWYAALFKIHNHSLFFPSFFWLADLRYFQGSQTMLFVAGLCLQTTCTLLLLFSIWRDPGLDPTVRSVCGMTMVAASFWMGRAAITASGGFNCMASLALLGALGAFLLLPRLQSASGRLLWQTSLLMIACGFVATFSFGSGAAVWPTLLFLGWSLRLSWRPLVMIFLAGVAATAIYGFLPPPQDQSELLGSLRSTPLFGVAPLKHLCWFLGAPVFYSIKAWQGTKNPAALVQSSELLVFIGAVGLAVALLLLGTSCFRRSVRGQHTEFLGLALIAFNLSVAFIVMISRVEIFQMVPVDAAAPRYLYWSSLFWTGLVLVALHHGSRRAVAPLARCRISLRFHDRWMAGASGRGAPLEDARLLTDEGATALINGVTDPERLLAAKQDEVDTLLPALRARRLDMFAMGLQDWIGKPVSRFQEKEDTGSFSGHASIKPLKGGRDQDQGVKVTGRLVTSDSGLRHTMVIVAPDGTIAGIARSFHTSPLLNTLLFGGRMPDGRIAGYIRDYHPDSATSFVRPFEGIASQQIAIQPAAAAQ